MTDAARSEKRVANRTWTGPFTREEFLERADDHQGAAEKAERIGPNIAYARTFRACAAALRIAADHMDELK